MSMRGSNIVNNTIDKLPFEIHIPTYSYCGPGTDLQKRLNRNDPGINVLDEACKYHDITYAETKDKIKRNVADQILSKKAWERVRARDSSFGEKTAALVVANIMKAKSKLGMGLKKKMKKSSINLSQVIKAAKKSMKTEKSNGNSALKTALMGAKHIIRKSGGKTKIKVPKVVPVPKKIGGVIPLIPLFAGLSAIGTIAGGVSGIAKAVNDFKSAKEQLKESERHNKMMESIAIGKGVYLAPYKTGSGLYLNPYPYQNGNGLKKSRTIKKNIKFTKSSTK